jgi:hypothetical protein
VIRKGIALCDNDEYKESIETMELASKLPEASEEGFAESIEATLQRARLNKRMDEFVP